MWIKKRRLLIPLLILLLLPLVVGVAGAGSGGDAMNGIHPEAEVLEENGAAGRADKGEEPGLSLKDLEGLEETLDGIVTELVSKFGDVNDESFWHPYFATQDSREVLGVEWVRSFPVPQDVLLWRHARIGLRHRLLGLRDREILVMDSQFKEIATWPWGGTGELEGMAVFTKWSDRRNRVELWILVTSTQPGLHLLQFQEGEEGLVQRATVPLTSRVKALHHAQVGSRAMAVLVPEDGTKGVDIYNVDADEKNPLWFFQRLPALSYPVGVVFDSDLFIDSLVALGAPGSGFIQLYSYDAKVENKFTPSQKLDLGRGGRGCRRLFAFTVAYQNLLGCMLEGEEGGVVLASFNHNKQEYELMVGVDRNVEAFYPLAVPDYTDQYLVITRVKGAGPWEIWANNGEGGFRSVYNCSEDSCPRFGEALDLGHGVGFRTAESSTFVFPGGLAWEITSEIKPVTSPLQDESRGIYKEYKALEADYELWRQNMSMIEGKLNKSLQLDRENVVTGSWSVDILHANEVKGQGPGAGVHFDAGKDPSFLTFGGSVWEEADYGVSLHEIELVVKDLERKLREANKSLEHAVPRDSPHPQVVTKRIRVKGPQGSFEAKDLSADRIKSATLNQMDDVRPFFAQFVQKEENKGVVKVGGGVRFLRPISVEHLKSKSGKVNDTPLTSIAKRDKENVFSCPVVFKKGIQAEGRVTSDLVNGFRLKDEVMGPEGIEGLHFLDGIIVLNDTLSEGALSFDNVVLKSVSQVVNAPVTFHDLYLEGEETNVSFVNGKEFVPFAQAVVLKGSRELIRGTKTFLSTLQANDLDMRAWNGVPFPEGFFRNRAPKVVLNGPVEFEDLTTRWVIPKNNATINGHRLGDLVTSKGTQRELIGTWTFLAPVKVVRDLPVGGTVDGVRMEELGSKANLNLKTDFQFWGDVAFEGPLADLQGLEVKDTINGESYKDMWADLLLFNDTKECLIPGETVVQSSLLLDHLNLSNSLVNGRTISDLFLLRGDGNLTSVVTLEHGAAFTSIVVLGEWDGVGLSDLVRNGIRINNDGSGRSSQIFQGAADFESLACSKEGAMEVKGQVNGVDGFGEEVAVTQGRKEQRFKGQVRFQSLIAESAVVRNDFESKEGQTVGGLDLSFWKEGRIDLAKGERLEESLEVEGQVRVLGILQLQRINGVGLDNLTENTLRVGPNGELLLPRGQDGFAFGNRVTFLEGLEVVGGAVELDTLNGKDLNEIRDNAFPLNRKEVLELHGNWHFQSIQVLEAVEIIGETCGVDLKDLESSTLRRGQENVTFRANELRFSDIQVEKAANVEELNGRKPETLFTLHGDQRVDCRLRAKDVTSLGDLSLEEDGGGPLNVTRLLKAYQGEEEGGRRVHVVKEDIFLPNELRTETLKVQGPIQQRDFLTALKEGKFLRVNDPNLVFTGDKTFTSQVKIEGEVGVREYNGIDVDHLLPNILLSNQDLRITRPVTFKNVVSGSLVSVTLKEGSEGITTENVNGMEWSEFVGKVVPLKEEDDHTFDFIPSATDFEVLTFDHVRIDKMLKVVGWQEGRFDDLVPLTQKAEEEPLSLESLKVKKVSIKGAILDVKGLLNGHNLADDLRDVVGEEEALAQGEEPLELQGEKNFTGTITIGGDFSCPSMDHWEGEVIPLEQGNEEYEYQPAQPLVISNPRVKFNDPLRVEKELQVKGTVEGQSLPLLIEGALRRGVAEQRVSGPWKFSKVTFKGRVQGDLEGFDLNAVHQETELEVRAAEDEVMSQKLQFREDCYRVRNATGFLGHNPLKLDGFDKHQGLRIRGERMAFLKGRRQSYLLTLDREGCDSSLWEWRGEEEMFGQERSKVMNLGRVKDWVGLGREDEALLVFRNEEAPCSTLRPGLHLLEMGPEGSFESGVRTLLVGEGLRSFRAVTERRGRGSKTLVAVLGPGRDETRTSLTFFLMRHMGFEAERRVEELEGRFEALEVTEERDGVLLLLVGEEEFQIRRFRWGRGYGGSSASSELLGRQRFLSGVGRGRPVLFKTFNQTVAAVPERGGKGVQVFSLMGGRFLRLNRLDEGDEFQAEVVFFSGQVYVAFLSRLYGLNLYQFRGLSGLERMNGNPVKLFHGLDLLTFTVSAWDFRTQRPFLAVLTTTGLELYHSVVYGDSLDYSLQAVCDV